MEDEFKDAIEAGNGGKSWDEKERSVVIGTYKAQKSNVGPNNSNMYMLREDGEDEDTGVWGSTVIDGRFDEIPIGSRVRVEYLGKKEGKRGQFKDYSVKYNKPSQGADVEQIVGGKPEEVEVE